MNKIISLIVLVFLFCGVKTFSQIYVPVSPTVYGVNELRHKAFLAQHIPEKTYLLTNTNDTTAQIFMNKGDSNVWAYYKPRGFFKIGSGGGGFALDSIYVFDLIDTNMTLHPGHVSIFVSHLILDSLKHKYIDTGARMRNGYVLSFDSTNKKWVMVPNAGGGGGGGGTLQNAADASILASDNPTINFHQNSFSMDSTSFSQSSYGGSTKGLINNVGGSVTLSVEDPSDLVRGTSISMNLNTIIVNPRTYGTVGFVQLVNTVNSEADSLDVVAIDTTNGYLYRKRISGGNGIYGGNGTLPSDITVTMAGHGIDFNDASGLDFQLNIPDGAFYFTSPLGKELRMSDDVGGFEAKLEGGNNIILKSSGISTSASTNSFIGSTWDWNDGGSNHYLNVSSSGVNINNSFILPLSDGSSNQFMKTNGSGIVSWSNIDTTNISNFSTKVRSLFSVSSPLTYNNATGAFAITTMDATHAGYVAAGVASKKRLGGDGNWYDTTASSTGTVTIIATGYGLSGGTITTTGTIIADSTLLLTKLRATSLYEQILSGTGYSKFSGQSVSYLTPTQVTADLNLFTTSLQGLVPGGGTAGKVLHGDGTWKDTTASTGGTVTSVSGTSNRITSTGGTTPVIDISASYVGQSSITTLGTVTTGTLSTGAVIGGVTMTLGSDAQGDIYYRNGSGILTRLATGTTKQNLHPDGSGGYSWKDSAAVTGQFWNTAASNTLINRTTNGIGTSDTSQFRVKTKATTAIIIDSLQNVGIGTVMAGTRLSMDSTSSASGFSMYNRLDQTTNYERIRMYWSSNVSQIANEKGGTGAIRDLNINSGSSNFLNLSSGSSSFSLRAATFNGIDAGNGDVALVTGGSKQVRLIGSNTFFGGATSPTAKIQIAAGTATANTAPLKFTSGTSLTTPEAGAVEYDGTHFYGTTSTPARIQLDNQGTSYYTHNISTPTTGGTVSLTNNQYNIINPAGTLLALTVNLPSSPINNDVVYIKFTQTITTVTYANGTVVDGIAGPAAGGVVILVYDAGTTSWY